MGSCLDKARQVLSFSTDKPRMECCEDLNGTIVYSRAVQGRSHGARLLQLYVL